jgi:hypothetical protein
MHAITLCYSDIIFYLKEIGNEATLVAFRNRLPQTRKFLRAQFSVMDNLTRIPLKSGFGSHAHITSRIIHPRFLTFLNLSQMYSILLSSISGLHIGRIDWQKALS